MCSFRETLCPVSYSLLAFRFSALALEQEGLTFEKVESFRFIFAPLKHAMPFIKCTVKKLPKVLLKNRLYYLPEIFVDESHYKTALPVIVTNCWTHIDILLLSFYSIKIYNVSIMRGSQNSSHSSCLDSWLYGSVLSKRQESDGKEIAAGWKKEIIWLSLQSVVRSARKHRYLKL